MAVLVEAREQLHQDPLAKAGGMHGDEEEADVAQLLARLVLLPVGGIDDEPSDLRRPLEVVPDGQHPVLEVPVDALAVVLLLVDVEEDVGRVPGTVLRDDERAPDHLLPGDVLEDEDILALERVADPSVEGAGRPIDGLREVLLVVGQIDRVELASELVQPGQVALLHVAQDVRRH